MLDHPKELPAATPVLGYAPVEENRETVWALRFVGAWIIAMSLAGLAKPAAYSLGQPLIAVIGLAIAGMVLAALLRLPARVYLTVLLVSLAALLPGRELQELASPAGGLTGVAIGMAVLGRQRWALPAAAILAALSPVETLTYLDPAHWREMVFTFSPGLVMGIANAALLCVFYRYARRSRVLPSDRQDGFTPPAETSATLLLVQLAGWRCLVYVGTIFAAELIAMTIAHPIRPISPGSFLIIACFLLLGLAGLLMVRPRAWAILLAAVMNCLCTALPVALFLPAPQILTYWQGFVGTAVEMLALCALLIVLYLKTRRNEAIVA